MNREQVKLKKTDHYEVFETFMEHWYSKPVWQPINFLRFVGNCSRQSLNHDSNSLLIQANIYSRFYLQ